MNILVLHFILGSQSIVKLSALSQILAEEFPDLGTEIHSYDVPSGVPEQPFDQEGIIGAGNRSLNAMKKFLQEFETEKSNITAVSIGIENFIQTTQEEGGIVAVYQDIAAICVYIFQSSLSEPLIILSEGVTFPNEYVEEARMKGTTAGKIMKEKGAVKSDNDPHIDLVGKSRVEILKAALRVSLHKVISQLLLQ